MAREDELMQLMQIYIYMRNFTCRKCEGNIGEAVEQEERLCNEVETEREFTYVDDRVCAGGGCEATVTARTRCGCVKSMECGELLYCRRFPLKLKWAVCKSCVRHKASNAVWK